MKRYIHDLILIVISIGFGIIIYGSINAWTTTEPEPIIITEYRTIEAEPEIITETVYVPCEMNEFLRNLSEEDEWYLKDIAMREAEGEDVIGQCWVMYCVLCRCEVFGKTIKQVCESSAFDSSKHRSGLTPNENCNKALELIKEGWQPKPLWFARGQYHSNLGYPLCQYGNHCFSCK